MNFPLSNLTEPNRRRWVKQFMLGSAAALIGPRWSSSVLAEVVSTGPGPGVLRLKPSSFPVLANPGGSIQLGFMAGNKPLTLNRVAADRFVTLDTICTHSQCTVGRYKEHILRINPPLSAFYMRCPCHGSRYDIEGRVFRNAFGDSTEPAPDDLGRFETSYDAANDLIAITIPDLALHIDSISVHQQGENGRIRLKLVFPTSYGADYEIRYQSDLSSPLQIALFSLTPNGQADQTSTGSQVQGDFAAFVDATGQKGFFVVGVKLTDVA